MASSESRQISEFSGRDEIHLNRLVYRFDRENPWQYFRDGIPLSSSVERGLKKTSAKMTKIYVNKRRGVRVRKKSFLFGHHKPVSGVFMSPRVLVKARCKSSSANHTAAETESVPEKLQRAILYTFKAFGSQHLFEWPKEGKLSDVIDLSPR